MVLKIKNNKVYMGRYEYKAFSVYIYRLNETLNRYAEEGWEVKHCQVTIEPDADGRNRTVWNVLMEREVKFSNNNK